MSKVKITRGKFNGITALADQNGIIAAAAMDQRGSLKKSIAKARGSDATGDDLVQTRSMACRLRRSARRMPACCWPMRRPATTQP